MVVDHIPTESNKSKTVAAAKRAAAKIRATRLPEIADVLPEKRDAFCKHVAEILISTRLGVIVRAKNRADIFGRIERAANELNNAVLELTSEQFDFLQGRITARILWSNEVFTEHPCPPVRLATALPLLAAACSDIVGKNPFRKGQEGNIRDWEFHCFVWVLWECARKHGGKLNASKRENKYFGAMFKALSILQDLWGAPLVKDEPPLFRPGQEQSVVILWLPPRKGIPGYPKQRQMIRWYLKQEF
jgi:hypothetical protein